MGCALRADRLAVGWNGQAILSDVSFTLAAGRILAIVGESGCGKSTLLAALAGLRPALAGRVTWVAGDRAVKPKKAMLWQSLALLPWKRVRANLALPLVLEGRTEAEIGNRTAAMLQEMELTGLEDRFPHELSGGQRQRLALGRALIVKPDILFMDEPFSALDAILRERMQDLLKTLWTRHGCSVVMVTHDMGEAAYLAQDILMLAARPTRVAAFVANPAFSAEGDVRSGEAFYAVQKRLHAAFAAVRRGETVTPDGGDAW